MTIGRFLGALFSIAPGLALAAAPAPIIPDTPAGHALAAWLDAFNSGDRATFQSFQKAHAPWLSLDQEMKQRARTGGYDLVTIDKGDKLWIVFRVKERASSAQTLGSLVVRSSDADHIRLLKLAPTGANAGEVVLDEAERSRVIDGAAKLLAQFYLFPDVGRTTAEKLRTQQKQDAYRDITDGQIFAIRLTDDLRTFTGDKHVTVDFFAKSMPPAEPTTRPRPDPARLAATNCGFAKAEHHPPNIGYLKLNGFEEPDNCGSTAVAAMTFLADSDSIIIDLRDNGGGAPRMAALISSYLFDELVHLDDLYDRNQNITEQFWTFPYVPGKKKAGKNVFVLISNRTFSAGEVFSYDLKSLKRATLIGETTGGGAHTVAPHRIDDHFFIRVPFGRFINPITKTNWESTGVEPDVKVPAADALDEALKRARSGH
ncbi:S41 family peptidase [Peristeroidobacter agariperforans]|uniref:S41 family peptidase n=1 Tax=Peristeroidobacter agariperforans TaxID=268404 RepID=UPI0018E4DFBC|nr:S41 family peptidase [Peristeroidobacter agariperforans]